MEHQYGTEHGTEGCRCPCHTTGAKSCGMCAPMHGGMHEGMHGVTAADPAEMMVIMWRKAFFKAQMELMKEKMKEKIEAAMGPMADKAADAVFESMGKTWQSMLLQTEAEAELREKLAKILSEGKKQK